jgi:hypothetical protein
MPDYSNGKIYSLESDCTNKIYIGSTSEKSIKRRLSKHKSNHKRGKRHSCTASKILKYEDVKIILLEDYPCNNKDELSKREQEWIENNKDICVNKNRTIAIKKRPSALVTCKYCGITLTESSYKRHSLSITHQEAKKYMNKILK